MTRAALECARRLGRCPRGGVDSVAGALGGAAGAMPDRAPAHASSRLLGTFVWSREASARLDARPEPVSEPPPRPARVAAADSSRVHRVEPSDEPDATDASRRPPRRFARGDARERLPSPPAPPAFLSVAPTPSIRPRRTPVLVPGDASSLVSTTLLFSAAARPLTDDPPPGTRSSSRVVPIDTGDVPRDVPRDAPRGNAAPTLDASEAELLSEAIQSEEEGGLGGEGPAQLRAEAARLTREAADLQAAADALRDGWTRSLRAQVGSLEAAAARSRRDAEDLERRAMVLREELNGGL